MCWYRKLVHQTHLEKRIPQDETNRSVEVELHPDAEKDGGKSKVNQEPHQRLDESLPVDQTRAENY